MYPYLVHLAGIIVKFPRTTIDFVEAHEMIQEVTSFLSKTKDRLRMTQTFPTFMCKVCTTLCNAEMARISLRQQHRYNAIHPTFSPGVVFYCMV